MVDENGIAGETDGRYIISGGVGSFFVWARSPLMYSGNWQRYLVRKDDEVIFVTKDPVQSSGTARGRLDALLCG